MTFSNDDLYEMLVELQAVVRGLSQNQQTNTERVNALLDALERHLEAPNRHENSAGKFIDHIIH
jgi:hypothetical protein